MSREERERLDLEGNMVGAYKAFLTLEKTYMADRSQVPDWKEQKDELVAAFRSFFESFAGAEVTEPALLAWCQQRGLEKKSDITKAICKVEQVSTNMLVMQLTQSLERTSTAGNQFFTNASPENRTSLVGYLRGVGACIRAMRALPPDWPAAHFLEPAVQRLESNPAPMNAEEERALTDALMALQTAVERQSAIGWA